MAGIPSLIYQRGVCGGRGRYVTPWTINARIQQRLLLERTSITQIIDEDEVRPHRSLEYESLGREGDILLVGRGKHNFHAMQMSNKVVDLEPDDVPDPQCTYTQKPTVDKKRVEDIHGSVTAITSFSVGDRKLFFLINDVTGNLRRLHVMEFAGHQRPNDGEDAAPSFPPYRLHCFRESQQFRHPQDPRQLRVCNDRTALLCSDQAYLLKRIPLEHRKTLTIFQCPHYYDSIATIECDPFNDSLCYCGMRAGIVYPLDMREPHNNQTDGLTDAFGVEGVEAMTEEYSRVRRCSEMQPDNAPGTCTAMHRYGPYDLIVAHNSYRGEGSGRIRVWDVRMRRMPVAVMEVESPNCYPQAVIRTINSVPIVAFVYEVYKDIWVAMYDARNLSLLMRTRCSPCSTGSVNSNALIWNDDERIDFVTFAQVYSLLLPGLGG